MATHSIVIQPPQSKTGDFAFQNWIEEKIMIRQRRLLLRGMLLVGVIGVLPVTIGTGGVEGQGLPAPASPRVEVTQAIQHDVSPPLRDIPSAPQSDVRRERPLRPIPANILAREQPDPVVQSTTGPSVVSTPGLGFPGAGSRWCTATARANRGHGLRLLVGVAQATAAWPLFYCLALCGVTDRRDHCAIAARCRRNGPAPTVARSARRDAGDP